MTEESIFTEALKKSDPTERQAYLDEACAGQPEMRQEVEALLQAHDGDEAFLQKPAAAQLASLYLPRKICLAGRGTARIGNGPRAY